MSYNHRARQPSSSTSSSFAQPAGAIGQGSNDERDINSAGPAPFSIDRTHPQYGHNSQQIGSHPQGLGHQQLNIDTGASYGHYNTSPDNVYGAGFGISAAYPYQTFADYGTNQQYSSPTSSYPNTAGYSTGSLQSSSQQIQPSWSQDQGYETLPQAQLRSVRYSPSSVELGAGSSYPGGTNNTGQPLQRHASAGNLYPNPPHASREHHAALAQSSHSRPTHSVNQPNEPTASRQLSRQRIRVPQKKFSAHYHITTPNPVVHFSDPSTGAPGVMVKAALEEGSPRVKGHRDVVFAEDLPATITLRIVWPGYEIYSRRIGTKTSGSNPRPLNRGEVANAIYETLKLFFMDKKVSPTTTPDDRVWKIGRNNGVTLGQVVLINLEQVTQGSWQPELMVEREV